MNHDSLIACVGFAVFAITVIAVIESLRAKINDD